MREREKDFSNLTRTSERESERMRKREQGSDIGSRLALENADIVASYHHCHMIADTYQQNVFLWRQNANFILMKKLCASNKSPPRSSKRDSLSAGVIFHKCWKGRESEKKLFMESNSYQELWKSCEWKWKCTQHTTMESKKGTTAGVEVMLCRKFSLANFKILSQFYFARLRESKKIIYP